jgi:hypothetical protein
MKDMECVVTKPKITQKRSCRQRVRRGIRLNSIFLATSLLMTGMCCSCGMRQIVGPPPTVWTATMPSPDGSWIASASTIQNGGFGSASIDTVVFLKHRNASGSGKMVLAFSCNGPVPRPYVLDNKANAGGTIDLQMKWLNSSHLDVTYDHNPELNFEVVKYDRVEISARNLSHGSGDAQQ